MRRDQVSDSSTRQSLVGRGGSKRPGGGVEWFECEVCGRKFEGPKALRAVQAHVREHKR